MLPRVLSFDGRSTRKVWWIGGLVVVLAMVGALLAIVGTLGGFNPELPEAEIARKFASALVPVLAIGLWPMLALTVTRLHDLAQSGWWAVPMLLPGLVLAVVDSWLPDGEARPLFCKIGDVASWIILIVSTIYLGFVRGTGGANQYGPDPLATAVGAPPSADAMPPPSA